MDHLDVILNAVSDLDIHLKRNAFFSRFTGHETDVFFIFVELDALEDAHIVQAVKQKSRVFMQGAVTEPFGDQGKGHHGFSIQNMGTENRISIHIDFALNGHRKIFFFIQNNGRCQCGFCNFGNIFFFSRKDIGADDHFHRQVAAAFHFMNHAHGAGVHGNKFNAAGFKLSFERRTDHPAVPGSPVDGNDSAIRALDRFFLGHFI